MKLWFNRLTRQDRAPEPIAPDTEIAKMEVGSASVRFIREGAVLVDEFGAHSRLAKAIATALTAEPPLRVVGLVGAWGSGKSTVVNLMAAELKGRSTRIFLHDAWLHQSDAPRRAFLEELLRWIEREQLGETKDLQKALDQLLGKSELTQSTVTPQVSFGAGLGLAALLLVPLASQFVRVDWMKLGTFGFYGFAGVGFSRPFGWALGVMLTPFALLVGVLIFRVLLRAGGNSSLVALFANKVRETRTDVKTKDPDPTALEFQRFFREALTQIHSATNERLVIVIDNIDRLPKDEMLALWSTIRSLFHGEPASGEIAQRAPTVLLPIDEDAMIRSHPEDKVADGFAEKTFDVAFRLPTPVETEWQTYLGRRIREVFQEEGNQAWIEAAARVLEEAKAHGRTPRSINAFVNQTATLWLQWRDEPVSFAAMAYYVAHRREIEKDAWAALKTPAPWMFDFDHDWQRGVAALRYGARPDVAGQILIEPPIRKALNDFDAAELNRLSTHEGFAGVLRRLLDSFRYGGNGLSISHAILLLDGLDFGHDQNFRSAWASLAAGFGQAPGWTPSTGRDVDALRVLLRRSAGGALAQVVAAIPHYILQLDEPTLRSTLPTALAAIEAGGKVAEAANLQPPVATLQAGFETLMLIALAAPQDGLALRLLRPQIDASRLATSLTEAILHKQAPTLDGLFAAMDRWELGLSWERVVEGLWQGLDDVIGDVEKQALLGLVAAWEQVPTSHPAIVSRVGSEKFQSELVAALNRPSDLVDELLILALVVGVSPGSSARALTSVIDQRPDLSNNLDVRLTQTAPALDVAGLVDFSVRYEVALPLVAAIIGARLRRVPEDLDVRDIARRPTAYQVISQQAGDRLWPIAASQKSFWSALASNPSEEDLRPIVRPLLNQGEETGRAAALMATLLEHAPTGEWRETLAAGGGALDDLRALREHPAAPAVGGTLTQTLRALTDDLLTSDGTFFAENWFYAASCLSTKSRAALYRGLARKILKVPASNPLNLIRAGGDELLTAVLGLDLPDAFFDLVLDRDYDRDVHLTWVARRAALIGQALRSASPETLRRLRDYIDRYTGDLAPDDARRIRMSLLEIAFSDPGA